jgi:NAD(P)-dependent dehydrogenase (short-subunit alcohol dehydrogenase family)
VALQGKVVVITGASSGIGRATAQRFAETGARLVLAARRMKPLEVAVRECAKLGGQATAIQADVADPDSVENLARRAIETYGRIDIWVNNAAVALYARIDEGPLEAHCRVIETNLLGYLYGSRIALRIFRQQSCGVLVNVCSATAYVGQPYSSAYVASKFAIRGLSESIRQEVNDCPQIHVCTVMPGATDTPFFQHAGNYMGRVAQPLHPIADARRVAKVIVARAERPLRTSFVDIARVLPLLKAIAPGWIEAYVGNLVRKRQFRDEPAPASPGNLFEPMAEGDDISGGWRKSNGYHHP